LFYSASCLFGNTRRHAKSLIVFFIIGGKKFFIFLTIVLGSQSAKMVLGATASTTATDAARGVNKKMLHMGSDLRLVRESDNTWDRVSGVTRCTHIMCHVWEGARYRVYWSNEKNPLVLVSSRNRNITTVYVSAAEEKVFFFSFS
jgi:hypothetical protein